MDFGRVRQHGTAGDPDLVEVIFSTHQAGPDDCSPLHIVSAAQVAYWRQVEANYRALLQQLAAVITGAPAPR